MSSAFEKANKIKMLRMELDKHLQRRQEIIDQLAPFERFREETNEKLKILDQKSKVTLKIDNEGSADYASSESSESDDLSSDDNFDPHQNYRKTSDNDSSSSEDTSNSLDVPNTHECDWFQSNTSSEETVPPPPLDVLIKACPRELLEKFYNMNQNPE